MVNRSAPLRSYLGAMAPLYSVPIKLGILGLLGMHQVANFEFPQFFCQVFVFELACRSVASISGAEILQVSDQGQKRKVQYRMLDPRNLLSDDSMDKVFGYLEEKERKRARRAVEIAVRVRNAVAHGAIASVTDNAAQCYMHTILTAVECLAKAATHHMTAKAAYYIWENERNREHGFDVTDWFRAEGDVWNRLQDEASRID